MDSMLSAITPSQGLHHPYLAGESPNFIQTLSHRWNGALDPVPRSSNPVDFSWQFKTSSQFPTAVAVSSVSAPVSAPESAPVSAPVSAPISAPAARGGRRTIRRKRTRNTRRRRKSRK
jgi:hypothetical protein